MAEPSGNPPGPPHAARTVRMPAKSALANDQIDALAACATLSATRPFHFVHTAGCCNANAKCWLVHGCTRSMPLGTHNARFAGSLLAANQTADHVQDSRSGLQVSTRHGSAVPTSLLRCQHAPAVVFDPSVPVFWLFHAPEQTTAIVVLPSMDLVSGAVFRMN